VATPGRRALVKVSGSAVAFSDEPTTANAGRTRFQITDTAKRVWDRTATIVVERDIGGGGYGAVATSEYTLNRLKGTVIFNVTQAANVTVRVDGSYLPLATAAEAKSYDWQVTGENADAGIFGDTWMKRQQMRRDVTGTLSQWRTTDTYMETQLLAGTIVVLMFYSDSSLDFEMAAWALLNTQQIQAVVDGFVEQTVEFQGAIDTDGRAVSYDDVATAGASEVTSGLIHKWHPSAGSGQTVVDSVGTVPLQLGTTSGADADDPTWEASPPVLLMDATNDFAANVSPNYVGDLSAFSFEGVIRLTALPASLGFLMGFYDEDNPGAWFFSLSISSTGVIHVRIREAASGTVFGSSAAGVIAAGSRYHVVGTFDGTTARVWVNTVDVANVVPTGFYAEAGTNNVFSIGQLNPGNHMTVAHRHGTWRVYNRALSGSEISQNYSERKVIYTDLP
jgi:hypothetical protein